MKIYIVFMLIENNEDISFLFLDEMKALNCFKLFKTEYESNKEAKISRPRFLTLQSEDELSNETWIDIIKAINKDQ